MKKWDGDGGWHPRGLWGLPYPSERILLEVKGRSSVPSHLPVIGSGPPAGGAGRHVQQAVSSQSCRLWEAQPR